MGRAASFQVPLEAQLALLSRNVDDSEVVQAAVAAGFTAWEQVHDLQVGAGWEEHRVNAALDMAIDRGLVSKHELGRFQVAEWTR